MNRTGQEIDANPVSVPDFLATLCHAIGIDRPKEYVDNFRRPIKLVDDGVVITEILS
jgi:arylsulfatase A-like enzyme